MDEHQWLAEQFEANRNHLQSVAYRMLGSATEAEDAVQESWLRFSRSGASGVENLGGWLTTVVARICLDQLRSRGTRREEPLADWSLAERPVGGVATIDPEEEAILADSVGPALLVVLETLAPAERLAFVLHDMFAVSFDEIAPIVGRSPAAARQLASRARRRVQGASASETDVSRQREVVEAFLAASRGGSFDALLAVLDPDVVFRADATLSPPGQLTEVHGASAVAEQFAGRAKGAKLTLIDGEVGAKVMYRGQLALVLRLTVAGGRIAEIDAVGDPDDLAQLELVDLTR